MSTPAPVRVVLTGFMGAGKSTVGSILARDLNWDFVDLDAEIERRTGASIPEIFAGEGEPGFRRHEARIGAEALRADRVVVATGGGWASNVFRDPHLPSGTLTVWLRVSVAEALERVSAGGGAARPLLETADPERSARALMNEREPYYRGADFAVPTGGRDAAEVAAEILSHLRVRTSGAAQSRASGANAEK